MYLIKLVNTAKTRTNGKCQFLIGNVSHEDNAINALLCMKKLCQFLIGNVSRRNSFSRIAREKCQFLIGNVSQMSNNNISLFYNDVPIPHRQCISNTKIDICEKCGYVPIPHRQCIS